MITNEGIRKAAIYIRVSTQEQAEAGYSVGEQRERLLAYCKAKGYSVYDVYVDGGYSGSSLDRPAIQKLKSQIKNFDMVLVYKLDRLSRSQFDILDLIEKTFLPSGVDFVSMSEAFDTSTPFGRAMIGILGVFAQLEREQITERMTMGRKARAKEGKFHGGDSHPIGYEYVDGKLIVNEYEAEQVRIIFEMAADNKSNAEIIEALNAREYKTRYGPWSHSSRIAKTLRMDIYIGTVRFGDVVTPYSHQAIVSEELFLKANEIRSKRRDAYGKNAYNRTTMLSGLIWCSKCGARFTTTMSRKKKPGEPVTSFNRYHACYSRAFPNSKMARLKGCKNKIWRMAELEDAVDQEVRKVIFNKDYFEKISRPKSVDKVVSTAGLTKRIGEIERQITKLMELYSMDGVPFNTLSEKIDSLHKEKSSLENQVENLLEKSIPQSTNISEFHSIIDNAADVWDLADKEQKRFLLSSLIRRIDIDDENLNIEWTFLPSTVTEL